MKKVRILSIFLCFILLLCGCADERLTSGEAEIAPKVENYSATMVVLGDNLMHMPVVNDGLTENGGYDYSRIYSALREDIQNADLAVIGQETVLGGEELGLSGYPLFNSPIEVGETLAKEGFDVVLHASNHIMDRNING